MFPNIFEFRVDYTFSSRYKGSLNLLKFSLASLFFYLPLFIFSHGMHTGGKSSGLAFHFHFEML